MRNMQAVSVFLPFQRKLGLFSIRTEFVTYGWLILSGGLSLFLFNISQGTTNKIHKRYCKKTIWLNFSV